MIKIIIWKFYNNVSIYYYQHLLLLSWHRLKVHTLWFAISSKHWTLEGMRLILWGERLVLGWGSGAALPESFCLSRGTLTEFGGGRSWGSSRSFQCEATVTNSICLAWQSVWVETEGFCVKFFSDEIFKNKKKTVSL